MMKQIFFSLSDLILIILTCNFYVRKRIIRNYIYGREFKNVLDAGCGTGTSSGLFSQRQYYGVDIDEDAISYAKHKHKGYTFKAADLTNIRLKQKFDLVIIIGVLHHLNDAEANRFLNIIYNHSTRDANVIVIEAIHSINKMDFISCLLRYFDRGKYIRKTNSYMKLIEKKFKVVDRYEATELFFHYSVFFARAV